MVISYFWAVARPSPREELSHASKSRSHSCWGAHYKANDTVQDLEGDRGRHLDLAHITGSVSRNSIRTVVISLKLSNAALLPGGLMPPVWQASVFTLIRPPS